MLTKNTFANTVIKESSQAMMEEFFDNIKILINALGYKVLEPIAGNEDEGYGRLSLKIGKAVAQGMVTTEGFALLKGARLNEKTNDSMTPKSIEYRKKVMSSDKVVDLVTTEDILFSSSSAAAEFVLGYSVSGPQNWKDKNGITLKELE